MGGVNHLFQVLRRTETTAGCEERRHVITERTIIWMLLNRHHLNGIIAVFLNAGQHILREFLVSSNLFGILSHSYMALINQQRSLVGLEGLLLEFVFLLRIPYLCRENLGLIILYNTTTPGRNTLTFSPIPLHLHFVKVAVFNGFL